MSDIGGNTTAILQVQSENGVDEIGNPVISWEEADSYPGWLDLVSGNSPVQNYNAKISESSHYYITDYYRALANQDPEVCRMLIDGKIYLLISRTVWRRCQPCLILHKCLFRNYPKNF